MIDLANATPREVEGYLSEVIRKAHGNTVQDKASIKSSFGSYHIVITIDGEQINFDFKRKSVPRIVRAIRAIK